MKMILLILILMTSLTACGNKRAREIDQKIILDDPIIDKEPKDCPQSVQNEFLEEYFLKKQYAEHGASPQDWDDLYDALEIKYENQFNCIMAVSR